MADYHSPADWLDLHDAAWACGWSLSNGDTGPGRALVYRAAQFVVAANGWAHTDTGRRRTFGDGGAVRAWVAAGCPAGALTIIQLRLFEEAA